LATPEHSAEIWKDIPGWEGFYQASSEGRIRSIPRDNWRPNKVGDITRFRMRGRILRAASGPHGYRVVVLSDATNGRPPKMFRVNRLICATFHGQPPSHRPEAAHGDGDLKNNCAFNLRWASRQENINDKKRHKVERLAIGG